MCMYVTRVFVFLVMNHCQLEPAYLLLALSQKVLLYMALLWCLLIVTCVVILSQPSIMLNYIGQDTLTVLSAATT